ncbi:MAG: NAD(P)-binding domain-containing protein [Ilumatobacteraceae bacterium]
MTTTEDTRGHLDAATVVVLGLGNIGSAVAERLVAAGEEVVGVDPIEAARTGFAERTGAATAANLDDVGLAERASVFVVVRMADEALAVLDGLAGRATDLTAFVLTTFDTGSAARLAAPRAGVRVIELPVSGGRQGALDGTLTVMTAGPLEAADRQLLERTIAGRVVEFEQYGHPTAAKLHNNALAALHAVAHAHVIELAAANGVDPARLAEVIENGSAQSWMGTNLAVVVDDLLVKDVELFEQCFGELDPVGLRGDRGLEPSLRRARALLSGSVAN